jgi:hypothetical protein
MFNEFGLQHKRDNTKYCSLAIENSKSINRIIALIISR